MLVFALGNRMHSRVGGEDAGICIRESDVFQG